MEYRFKAGGREYTAPEGSCAACKSCRRWILGNGGKLGGTCTAERIDGTTVREGLFRASSLFSVRECPDYETEPKLRSGQVCEEYSFRDIIDMLDCYNHEIHCYCEKGLHPRYHVKELRPGGREYVQDGELGIGDEHDNYINSRSFTAMEVDEAREVFRIVSWCSGTGTEDGRVTLEVHPEIVYD